MIDKQYKISTVIVTFNRKTLLKRCLDAVSQQTYKPQDVYIMDNASTDGTMDSVKEWGFYEVESNGIRWHYILNDKNEGGSGGFYKGMKTAFEETNPDALWVMDDDGEPAPTCLDELRKYLDEYDFLSPMVVSDEDRLTCSFTKDHEPYTEFIKKAENGIIKNWVNPFNGVLFSKALINKVGYPKKGMFIWGDEWNYQLRCINDGFSLACVVKSMHYHPVDRQKKILYMGSKVMPIEQDWKLYCYIRNYVYNCVYFSPYIHKAPFLKGIFYQLLELRGCVIFVQRFAQYDREVLHKNRKMVFVKAFFAGVFKSFGGQYKYMKKK